MNKEVIYIKQLSSGHEYIMKLNGITPPKLHEIYHVVAESLHEGTAWYAFKEYPDVWPSPNQFYRHYFEQKYFADVTGMQEQIEAALKAEKPKEMYFTALDEFTYTGRITRSYIDGLDFNCNPDFTITETRMMLNSARLSMQNSRNPFTQALALAQIDALADHLKRLMDKFNKY